MHGKNPNINEIKKLLPLEDMDDQTKRCPQCKGMVSQNAQECQLCGVIFKRYEETLSTLSKDAILAYENGDLPHSKKLFETLIERFPDLTGSAQSYLKKIEDRESNHKQQVRQRYKICLSVIAIAIFFVFYFIGFFSSSNSPDNSRSSISSSHKVVKNSDWDGSVRQVKSWLKANLKDPGSLQFIEWSSVKKTDDGGFMVRVKYRAKNSFGGYVVENKVFFLNSAGDVANSIDY